MRTIDARVVGFDYTTFHAYRTEVEVDGREWMVALRYNTFFQFYTQLTALEKHFSVSFPPKGGLFFSPPPEERQEQLDEFLLGTLAYFDMRGQPKRMEALLDELLQISEHMTDKNDSDEEDKRTERTASEGSSVADELLLDTPMPAHDTAHDQAFETKPLVGTVSEATKKEAPHEGVDLLKVFKAKAALVSGAIQAAVVNTMQENVEAAKSKEADKETAEEIKTDKEDVGTPKAETTEEEKTEEKPKVEAPTDTLDDEDLEEKASIPVQPTVEPVVDSTVEKSPKVTQMAPVVIEEAPVVAEKPQVVAEKSTPTVQVLPTVASEPETSVEDVQALAEPSVEAEEVATPLETAEPAAESTLEDAEPIEEKAATAAEPVEPVKEKHVAAPQSSADSTGVAPNPVEEEPVKEDVAEAIEDKDATKVAAEPVEKEAEGDHPVVNWFRRLGTFGQPSGSETDAEKAEEAVTPAVEDVSKEANPQGEEEEQPKMEGEQPKTEAELEAEALAIEEAAAAARTKAEVEAEIEFLQAQEAMDKRLRPYRHPVFFQGFNCDIGTSRYSAHRRLSSGVLV